MKIDDFYKNETKSGKIKEEISVYKDNFYLGMISKVYRENSYVQVENLSLLNHRNIRLEKLIPNTINFFVVIDSVQGIFIGEVYQSQVDSSVSVHESMNQGFKEKIYPEIAINILGLMHNNQFKLSGFKTVGITDKVYIANKKIIRMFINSIEINKYKLKNQKHKYQIPLKNIGFLGELEDENLSLKPNTLFDHHLMAVGTTNSGKSTSSLTIIDRMLNLKKKTLIIDPTGEYEESFTDSEVNKLTLGADTFLKTESLETEFWIDFFNVSNEEDSNKASVLSAAIESLRYQKYIHSELPLRKEDMSVKNIINKISSVKTKDFNIGLLAEQVKLEAVKQARSKSNNTIVFKHDGNLYNATLFLIKRINFLLNSPLIKDCFGNGKNNLLEHLNRFIKSNDEKSLYINLSKISKTYSVGKTIIDLITKFIIDNKDTDEGKPFVLYIDEVHRYINRYDEESGLVSIAREGRKKGVFLFLTTQTPKDVPDMLLGQMGTILVHNLNSYEDINCIKNKIDKGKVAQISKLNQGEAILASINLIQNIQVSFKKTRRKHKNATPII
ncbi:ATP-binding protein [Apilactobacillus xinyiensis]|uniref:ATP-binding protein n=1 Tax=Apilactobacillus xinyiensis TaxID=2841032 RepID=UPI00200E1573|nr:helicase HerA-like domain-containing protein [Apilactobacillus xinyiensis]MCL0330805.1 DUF853 family protein [Apilactobacillus xinyiensis]